MANTYTLIASNTLSTSAASVTFSSIPATYTDLVLKMSSRFDVVNTGARLRFNSDSAANYSWRRIEGDGANVASNSNTTYGSPYNTFIYTFPIEFSTQTSNTFNNLEIYVPNYAGSNNKPLSLNGVNENNATTAYSGLIAGLWSNSAAINSLSFTCDGTGNFVSGSTFWLYGIKNS